jgi:hypothetical protein
MVQKGLHYGILIFVLLILSPGFGLADLDDLPPVEDDNKVLEVSTGYRWVSTDDRPDRAAEYSFLEDSPTFNLIYKQDFGDREVSLVGDFVNYNDYYIEGHFDYKALFRLNARSERMFHNLDHVPYQDDPEARALAETTLVNVFDISDPDNPVPAPDLDVTDAFYSDHNPGVGYGRRITIDEIKLRAKLPTYPAHINLSYWRMEKKGKEQLRFVDENCASACHMQSRTRKIDRVTEEFQIGLDAHLGPVDIAFLQTLRKFREKESLPADDFDTHTLRFLGPPRELLHDETPDSRLTESTFIINLPQSGGFVSSASYTIGKRENESDLKTVRPVDAETDYQKLTADITYTPGEHWTFSFRYRMLDLDNDVPAIQTSDGVVSPDNPFSFSGIPVRESVDIDRNNYAAFISYRPSHRLTLKAEFEREDIDRSNTGVGQHDTFAGISDPNWALPDNETIDRYRLSFFSRMLEKSALKLNGWYEYTSIDNPAYGTSLSDNNEIFFSASYRPSAIWGATGSIDIQRGDNNDRTAVQFDSGPVPFDLNRDEERENLALGFWFVPSDLFSADLNYGLLHAKIDQDILFGDGPDTSNPGSSTDYTILDDNTDYEQRVHTLSAGINLRLMENLNCRLEGYHVRSSSEFSPGFDPRVFEYLSGDFVGEALASSGSLQEISKVNIRQNGVKARIRWNLSKILTAGFEYTFDDYEDRNANAFDGSAQTFIASLTGTF